MSEEHCRLGKGHSCAGVPPRYCNAALVLPLWDGQKGKVFHMAAAELKVSDDELARLRDKYPAWHIWMSQARRWWATRKGRITPTHSQDPRWSMTVDADTLESLDQQLAEQSHFS